MEDINVNLRKLNCELNVLSRPDGSAIFSQGNTVVIAAVYGPVECKIQNSDIYKATVEVCYGTKSGQTAVRERCIEMLIKQTCENSIYVNFYPRDAISISIQEMEDDGGLMASTLNACCLAILNCGLPMKYLFGAVHCAITYSGKIIVDPSTKELEDVASQMTFVYESVDRNLISSNTTGTFTPKQYYECLTICKRASENLFLYYREIVKKHVNY